MLKCISQRLRDQVLNAKELFPYIVTLAWGDFDVARLATVIFLSEQPSEDATSVAKALLETSQAMPSQKPCFDWTTLKVQGSNALTDEGLAKLLHAAIQGDVGVVRVTAMRFS